MALLRQTSPSACECQGHQLGSISPCSQQQQGKAAQPGNAMWTPGAGAGGGNTVLRLSKLALAAFLL